MGFFNRFKKITINEGIAQYKTTANAVLLDVRTPQEYREGHIPNSINCPLQTLDDIEFMVSSKETPLFVYCRSGARSRQAVMLLQSKGYTNVTNIGGILDYIGVIER